MKYIKKTVIWLAAAGCLLLLQSGCSPTATAVTEVNRQMKATLADAPQTIRSEQQPAAVEHKAVTPSGFYKEFQLLAEKTGYQIWPDEDQDQQNNSIKFQIDDHTEVELFLDDQQYAETIVISGSQQQSCEALYLSTAFTLRIIEAEQEVAAIETALEQLGLVKQEYLSPVLFGDYRIERSGRQPKTIFEIKVQSD